MLAPNDEGTNGIINWICYIGASYANLQALEFDYRDIDTYIQHAKFVEPLNAAIANLTHIKSFSFNIFALPKSILQIIDAKGFALENLKLIVWRKEQEGEENSDDDMEEEEEEDTESEQEDRQEQNMDQEENDMQENGVQGNDMQQNNMQNENIEQVENNLWQENSAHDKLQSLQVAKSTYTLKSLNMKSLGILSTEQSFAASACLVNFFSNLRLLTHM